MNTKKKKYYLFMMNRIAIVLLIIIGSLIDGYNLQDLFFIVASVLWLWLPEVRRFENKHLDEKNINSA